MDDTKEDTVRLTEDKKRSLIQKILERYQRGAGANEQNRRNFTADQMFLWAADSGYQWDPAVLQLRQGRPSYTFNLCLQPANNLIGDQRQTRPAVKVRPASENATNEVADICAGLWRSIEHESRAEAIYDQQFVHVVGGGWGEMMILPQYANDQAFDQVLRIINIPNPETVVRDPECTDPCGADARWCMVGSRISHELYEETYPDFDPTSFPMARDSLGWRTDGMVRIVDYFEKVAIQKTVAELSDGRIIDWTAKEKAVEKHLKATNPDGKYATVKRTRQVKCWKVRWVKTDGANILEGPIDYDWQHIPVVRMPGRYRNIEGRQIFQSFVRHAWDAQRAFNFQQSDAIERSALVAKSRYIVTAKMINGYTDVWNTAHQSPRIYLPVNVDKDAAANGGFPVREAPIDVPAGSLALAQAAQSNVQATLGIFQPALGNSDGMDRTSGKALVAHTRRSDLGTHEFIDGYGKALQRLCEIGLDMIPTVYDSARVVSILDGDGQTKSASVNQPGEGDKVMNDLKQGRYTCAVTLGPSYQTARQETLDTLIDAAQTIPAFAQITPDLIARAIDSPDSDEMAKRLRRMLIKQGIVTPTPEDLKEAGPQQPQQPSPMEQAELQRAQALAARDIANAHIAASRAGASDIELHRVVTEVANRHLNNLLLAQKLGQPGAAAQAEAQAANPPAAPAQVSPQ